MQKFLILAMAVLLFASCSNNNYRKTKSGLLYKIVTEGKGPQVKLGQLMKLQFSQKVRDSVVVSSFESGLPVYAKVDSVGDVYNVLEILPMLHKGDSVVVVEIGDTLQRKGLLPPFMKQSDKRTWSLKVEDIFDNAELADKDRTAAMEKYKNSQIAAFEKYMANKKDLKKSPSGTYVDVQTPGDGPAVDSGKMVTVHYTGKLMSNEKVFESSINTPGAQPYQFVIGQMGAIAGWDEGLRFFRKGGKGVLYVPFQMAYADRPGPGGLPFQNLIFDVQVLDVADAPKMAPNQMMPPQVVPDTTQRRK